MSARATPNVVYLHQRLDLNPVTGILKWNPKIEINDYIKSWNDRYAGKIAGHLHSSKRTTVKLNKRPYPIHRIIWKMTYGEDPIDQIDHINRDPTDNRPINLREANNSQNNMNKKIQSNNSSGVTGVFLPKDRHKWQAYITKNQKTLLLGTFDTKDQAIAARSKAELELFMDFRRT